MIVRASNVEEGFWRVAIGIRADVSMGEIQKHVAAKLERQLPGPRPLKYELVEVSPYWAHERVAKKFHSGRVILCGDAAYVHFPIPIPTKVCAISYPYVLTPRLTRSTTPLQPSA